MRRFFILFLVLILAFPSWSQKRKIQNRPYIDQRRFHYGFSIGLNMQDYEFINNGYITEDGQQWYADVSDYSPGFSVGVLGELYLTRHLALRLLPSLHFGNKSIVFRDYTESADRQIQHVKSTYLSLPIELKASADRFNNYRPYLMIGVNPMYDLNVKQGENFRFKPMDCFLEIGLGCDYYFPFFKLIPEIKFCFGLSNILNKDRSDLRDESLIKFTNSADKATSKMIVFTLYFE